jgi:hypothetical protein
MAEKIKTYPEFKEQVEGLVKQHKKLKNPKLRLAVYFAPPGRPKRDVFLLEVIDGFGGNTVDPKGELFEFGYGSTPVFPLSPKSSLRMVLTNPDELQEATSRQWKGVGDLIAAKNAGKAEVIYRDAKGKKLWDLI